VRTLGIDLASSDAETAACLVCWDAGMAVVERVECPAGDERLLALIHGADKTGIDVPLGWPEPFVRFVDAYHHGRRLPPFARATDRMRRTDQVVRERIRRWPLSVAADRIAMPAFRSAQLLARVDDGAIDRSGTGRIVEVYPAAALVIWGEHGSLVSSGYKGTAGRAVRRKLVADLLGMTKGWFRSTKALCVRCHASDHVFDALIAAFVARASALGLCEPIPEEERDLAAREGWIALPQPGSLAQLAR
jgi:hypothetical protein